MYLQNIFLEVDFFLVSNSEAARIKLVEKFLISLILVVSLKPI